MDKQEIIERISNGEDSYTQFKQQIISSKDLAKEFVAFSNANGGILIFGVDDDENIIGLEKVEVERIGQLVGNVANENIKPPIHPLMQNTVINNKRIVLVFIENGVNKPYRTSNGIFYTKSGADKKIISNEELKRLFSNSNNLYPDEIPVRNTSINDIDLIKLKKFLKNDNKEVLKKLNRNELELEIVLNNLELFKNTKLTLAGNLLFGETPQRYSPSFYIDCCYFDGNDISVTQFISKKTIKGTFDELYEDSIRFVVSQLRTYQVEKDFNYNGKLEIEREILTELIVNALVHRDYYINSSIKIFMFHDRVEIISPGKLTNSLTIEKIKNGIAVHRNPILSSICKSLLPYTAYGSGIKRVLKLNPDIIFINDVELEQFKCIILRNTYETGVETENTRVETNNTRGEINNTRVETNNTREEIKSTRVKIIAILRINSSTTAKELSKKLNISVKGVQWHIKNLKDDKVIRRIGPNKGGYWEVINKI